MARTDNTLPWKLREEDRPHLRWFWIENTSTSYKGIGRSKRAQQKEFWSSERRKASLAIRRGDEAPALSRAANARSNLL